MHGTRRRACGIGLLAWSVSVRLFTWFAVCDVHVIIYIHGLAAKGPPLQPFATLCFYEGVKGAVLPCREPGAALIVRSRSHDMSFSCVAYD